MSLVWKRHSRIDLRMQYGCDGKELEPVTGLLL